MEEIKKLLDELKDTFPYRKEKVINVMKQEDLDPKMIEGYLKLKISKPESNIDKIPTLEKGKYQQITPMLRSRFEYAGTIQEMSEKWLGISDMEKVPDNQKIMKHIQSHQKHWEGSAPTVYPFNRLSLFGIVIGEEENQTFLIWPEESGKEPEMYVYSGHSEQKFENLASYLKWVIQSE